MQREREGRRAPTSPANPNRFSRNQSGFRVGETDSETRLLATGNYYATHLERNLLAPDWSKLRCGSCGYEAEGDADARLPFARAL
jgi:hypothetical protein